MSPYSVLGVSETATQDEIRAAYLALVKKYHPDRYSDGPLKELAGEKLKEINRAYELIGKRQGATQGASTATSYGFEKKAGSTTYSGPSAAGFARVRSLISHNSLGAAAAILDSIHTHNAEWYYLYGIIYLRQGAYEKARDHIGRAYREEPSNNEYRNAYTTLHRTSAAYASSSASSSGTFCDDCSNLLCCNCCGRAFCCC